MNLVRRRRRPTLISEAAIAGACIGAALTGMRRTIAERMQRSWREAPHIDLTVDIDMSRAVALLERAKAKRSAVASRTTITAGIVKAVAWALGRHSRFNGYFRADRVVEAPKVKVGVAVDIPDGLIVPVVREAGEKDLQEISAEIERLSEWARD